MNDESTSEKVVFVCVLVCFNARGVTDHLENYTSLFRN